MLDGLHDLGAKLAADKLDVGSRKALSKSLSAASKQIKAHDPVGASALLDVRGELTATSGNALLIEAEGPLRTRVQFLSPRESDAYDWAALKSSAEAIEKFVKP